MSASLIFGCLDFKEPLVGRPFFHQCLQVSRKHICLLRSYVELQLWFYLCVRGMKIFAQSRSLLDPFFLERCKLACDIFVQEH